MATKCDVCLCVEQNQTLAKLGHKYKERAQRGLMQRSVFQKDPLEKNDVGYAVEYSADVRRGQCGAGRVYSAGDQRGHPAQISPVHGVTCSAHLFVRLRLVLGPCSPVR
ncbi:hypothetical protein Bbelb_068160 [Branchiostoma belcheri]|nr:hypothetical protein Bbelb_068160 [Branchiostoma belcheri]